MLSKKWVRFIGIALLILFISLHFFLQSAYLSDTIKHTVQTRLETAVGEKVEIAQVSVQLVPTALILKNLSMRSGSPDGPASLLAKEVRIAFSPASFFTETFFIQEIEITSPELQVSAPTAGDPALTLPSERRPGKAGARPFVVRSITVKKGDLKFKGEDVFKEISFSDFDFRVRPNLEMNRFEVDLDGKGGTYAIEDRQGKVDRVDGSLTIQGGEIVLKRGKIITDQGTLISDGTISIGEQVQIDLSIDLHHRLESMGLEQFAGEHAARLKDKRLAGEMAFFGRAKGSFPHLEISGALVLPALSMNGETVGTLKSKLAFSGGVLSLTEMEGKLFSGEISGTVKADLLVPATLAVGPEPASRETRLYSATLDYKNLPLYPFEQIWPKTQGSEASLLQGLFATGHLQINGEISQPVLNAEGEISLMRDPLFSPPLPAEAETLQRLLALLDKGHAKWRWSDDSLRIENGRLFPPDAEVNFGASWNPTDGLVADTRFNSRGIAPLAQVFHLPLSGETKIEGLLTHVEGSPSFKGTLLVAQGALEHVPFKKLETLVKIEGKRIAFTNGRLEGNSDLSRKPPVPPSDYRFLGDIDLEDLDAPRFDFNVKVLSGNPQEIFHFFRLPIPLYTQADGHLRIEGRGHDFSVKGPLSVGAGSLYGEDFQSGRVDLEVTRREVILKNAYLVRGNSRLEGEGAIAYDLGYWLDLKGTALRIQETGFLKNHFPDLSGEVVLSVTGKGSFSAPEMTFAGTVSALRYDAIENLSGAFAANWKKHAVQFNSRFPNPDLAIEGEVLLSPDHPFSFQSHFKQLQVDPFIKTFVSGAAAEVSLLATGELSGSGKLSDPSKINLAGTLSALSAGFDEYRLANDGPLAVLAEEGTFTFNQSRFKGDNTALVLNGSLSLLDHWALFINGEADLNLITFFTNEVASANGKALLDLSITDKWAAPHVFGEVKLKEGKIRTATLSQNLHINALTVLFNERQLVLETFDGQLGSGRFRVTGKALLSGFGIDAFGLLLQLEDARVNLAPDLPATVDGELFFKKEKEGKHQTLKGDLKIKKLVYQKKVDLASIIQDFQKKEKEPAPSQIPEIPLIGRTELNIHLSGDNGVQIANNLAQIPLGVDLLIKGSFDKPLLIGRIDASNGEIVFRNNRFRLTSGAVDFLNPDKIDPTFDLTAKTEVRNEVTKRNYKIDMLMSGTLSQITLSLSSFPSLPEDDILALLAIGKTSADLRTIKGGAGTEAGNFAVEQLLTDSVGQLTGFVEEPVEELTGTRLRVDPYLNGDNARTSTGTRLTAEKHLLRDRLLVVYSTTLDPSEEDLIRMVYEINKNISLVGNRDDTGQIGGDIRFRFEFR